MKENASSVLQGGFHCRVRRGCMNSLLLFIHRQPIILKLLVAFTYHSVSKLLESLSIGSGSSKLTKLFQHHHTSSSSSPSKKLDPTVQYLLQGGPQGLVRIWPTALSEEMNYCSFMINMTTTCAEIVKLVLGKYAVVDDPRRFYICDKSLGKGGQSCCVFYFFVLFVICCFSYWLPLKPR